MKAIKVYVEGEDGVELANNLRTVFGKFVEGMLKGGIKEGEKIDFGTDKYISKLHYYDVADEQARERK